MVAARPSIQVVTDRRRLSPDARTIDAEVTELDRWLDTVVEAGVDVIQIRESDLEADVLYGLVCRLLARTKGGHTRILVNDRADVALASGAAGVHLRADGPPVPRVRTLGPDRWIIGRSVHGLSEVASHQTADHLLFGTVFGSRSKAAGWRVAGLAGLRSAASRSAVPIVAIGGVSPATAGACIDAGASGVAGIGVFLPEGRREDALGVVRAVAALREAMGGC
jgi:thiamine-phosphate pyrophosphorylase